MKWINIEDKLPQEFDDLSSMVVMSDGVNVSVGFYSYDHKQWFTHDLLGIITNIISWMPLPELPKQ